MTKNIFGTDGIRSRVGTGFLTSEYITKIGTAIARWACERYGANPSILIACDTRISCDYIKHTLFASLLTHPVSLYDAGVMPTPAAHLVGQKQGINCVLIISASHNPFADNGIKIIDSIVGKLTEDDEKKLTHLIENEPIPAINYEMLGSVIPMPHANEIYRSTILALRKQISYNDITIVLDTANGASSFLAPELFRALGAHVITINNNPNGKNINASCGALHPELLQKKVIETNAHIGFAFDGDGDRVIAVNAQGSIINGDLILALLSQHPEYITQSTIVGTVMSNVGFENHLNAQKKQLIRTPVGDKYVFHALLEHNALLGGEPSGHIIMRDYLSTGDGIYVALKLLEISALRNDWHLTLCQLFPQTLINIKVGVKKDINDSAIQSVLDHYQQKLLAGRILVRYSGTENCMRIMVEDTAAAHAEAIAQQIAVEMQLITQSHI